MTIANYAILPAAGRSQRLGAAKLLLPWRGRTVIGEVIAAWQASRVDRIVVVVAPGDESLAAVVRATGVDLVVPADPPSDMKASVAAGLERVRQAWGPRSADRWLLSPADMPALRSASIGAVLQAAQSAGEAIVVPTFEHRRGHPIALPWSLADAVAALESDEGIDRLVARQRIVELPLDDPGICEDLDTAADYERLRAEFAGD